MSPALVPTSLRADASSTAATARHAAAPDATFDATFLAMLGAIPGAATGELPATAANPAVTPDESAAKDDGTDELTTAVVAAWPGALLAMLAPLERPVATVTFEPSGSDMTPLKHIASPLPAALSLESPAMDAEQPTNFRGLQDTAVPASPYSAGDPLAESEIADFARAFAAPGTGKPGNAQPVIPDDIATRPEPPTVTALESQSAAPIPSDLLATAVVPEAPRGARTLPTASPAPNSAAAANPTLADAFSTTRTTNAATPAMPSAMSSVASAMASMTASPRTVASFAPSRQRTIASLAAEAQSAMPRSTADLEAPAAAHAGKAALFAPVTSQESMRARSDYVAPGTDTLTPRNSRAETAPAATPLPPATMATLNRDGLSAAPDEASAPAASPVTASSVAFASSRTAAARAQTDAAPLAGDPGTPAWRSAFAERVTLHVKAGDQEARLTLRPADLGPINVHIRMEQGTTSISFDAGNAGTRQAIEDALPRLREMLSGSGLQLGGTHVGHDQRPGGQPMPPEPAMPRTQVAADEPVPATPRRATVEGNGRVDLFA